MGRAKKNKIKDQNSSYYSSSPKSNSYLDKSFASNSNSFNKKYNNNNFILTIYKISNDLYSLRKANSNNNSSNKTINISNNQSANLPFKQKNWTSKLRSYERNFRNAKNMKNLSKDLIDGISYKIYQELSVGPSILPKKKFCDFTGFETNYTELNSGIRYYNSDIYKLFQNMAQPIKDQYLNIRKALIRLK